MKGIEVPERTEDFTADPVELFFDLAYVFAFSQLVGFLVHHPDWTGIGQVALVFWLLWLPWSQFTWSANAVSGNSRHVRVVFLIGTAVSVPMAASVSTAFDDGGPVFAVSLSVIVLLGIITLVSSISGAPETKNAVRQWAIPSFVAIAVIVAGGFVDGDARIWLWFAATLIVLVGMATAGRNEWVIRPGHFAERHGLIIIIALGEVIVAIGAPVAGALGDGAGLVRSTALALIGVGAFAGLTWWSYFDRVSPALEHRAQGLTGTLERGRYARDVYTLAHALDGCRDHLGGCCAGGDRAPPERPRRSELPLDALRRPRTPDSRDDRCDLACVPGHRTRTRGGHGVGRGHRGDLGVVGRLGAHRRDRPPHRRYPRRRTRANREVERPAGSGGATSRPRRR